VDLNKLTTSDRLIVGGGIVYLIAMFLKWFSFEEPGFEISASGWDYFLGGIIPLILIVVMVAHVLVTRFSPSTDLPDLPVPWSQVHLFAGVAAAVIVLIRLVIPAEIEFGGFDTGEDFDRSYGIIIALIAAAAVAYGGFLKSKEGDDGATTTGGDTGTAPF
jgi:purine-cytosine permease-like protein